MFSILNKKKKPDKKIFTATRNNKDFAVDDLSPINSKIKINNSSIPDDLNNIQPEYSEIALNYSFVLDLGNLEIGSTQIKLKLSIRGGQKNIDILKHQDLCSIHRCLVFDTSKKTSMFYRCFEIIYNSFSLKLFVLQFCLPTKVVSCHKCLFVYSIHFLTC
jgi:hypothetical protein